MKKNKLWIAGLVALGAAVLPYRIAKDDEHDIIVQSLAYRFTKSAKDGYFRLEIPGTILQLKLTDVHHEKLAGKALYDKIVEYTLSKGKVSEKALKKHFGLGKASAEAYIEMMREAGIIEEKSDSDESIVIK